MASDHSLGYQHDQYRLKRAKSQVRNSPAKDGLTHFAEYAVEVTSNFVR